MRFLYYFQNFGHKKRSDKKVECLIFILLFIGIFKTDGDIKYFNSIDYKSFFEISRLFVLIVCSGLLKMCFTKTPEVKKN